MEVQSSSTSTLTKKVASPMDIGNLVDNPCASTVQGLTPSPAATSMPSPVPKSHRPMMRMVKVEGLVRQREGARHLVTGMVLEGFSQLMMSEIANTPLLVA